MMPGKQKTQLRTLVIEDDDSDWALIARSLSKCKRTEFEVAREAYLNKGLSHLGARQYDLILLDLSLPDSRGLATVQSVVNVAPHTPIVVMSEANEIELSLQAMAIGASHYISKDALEPKIIERSVWAALTAQHKQDDDRARFAASIKATSSDTTVEGRMVAMQLFGIENGVRSLKLLVEAHAPQIADLYHEMLSSTRIIEHLNSVKNVLRISPSAETSEPSRSISDHAITELKKTIPATNKKGLGLKAALTDLRKGLFDE